ncbi:GL14505 [Drosophila persimilis]|uniref:GL14505 n=1 Tax=Drosophila persimilis TaxID=7234 RepID=B4IRM3_DROPE|nr:GL14505 [Drosophila persimilis]
MANGQYGPSVHQMVKHKQHALVSGAPSSPSALRGLRAENGPAVALRYGPSLAGQDRHNRLGPDHNG